VRLVRVQGMRSDAIAVLDAALMTDDPVARSRGRRAGMLRAAARRGTATDVSPPRRAATFERMLEVLAEAVVTATGPDDLVVVGGCPEAAREAAAWLDARTPRDVVLEDALGEEASEADVRAAAARATLRWRGRRNADRLGELAERGQASLGHAIGIMAVASALEHGAVRELLLSRGFLDEEAALAEDLVAITLQQSGTVVTLEGDAAAHLDAEGGVAALLRFIPIPSAYGVGWESSGTAA
jgi:stalled ribosome rescue protein Dom34